jgi:hypothetical protein
VVVQNAFKGRPIFTSDLRIFWPCRACIVLAFAITSAAQTSPPVHPSEARSLNIVVLDENNVAVPEARVRLVGPSRSVQCETDLTGHCKFASLAGSPWQLRVDKEGFYAVELPSIQTSGALDVELHHQEEIKENVNVVESVPAIDPAQVSSQEGLSGIDILDIPYPNTRDYRYALEYIPGVVLDQSAQPHVAGAETYETLVLMDGFNVTQPANGLLLVRPSTDSLRKVTVETSRVSAEYGKGPAGALSIETGIGDDHYRFAATNFLPSFQHKTGWSFDKVDPRFTVSGPIVKGKLWFFDGLDGEYDHVIIPQLAPNENKTYSDIVWRGGNIAKVQANVTTQDIITGSFLLDWLHDDHQGFSALAPPSTRPRISENVSIVSVKEQHTFSRDTLLELGFAFDRYGSRLSPSGSEPYVLTPSGAVGNYYLSANNTSQRSQALANFYIPGEWHGRHALIFGTDLERLSYEQLYDRSPVSSIRQNGVLAGNANCLGPPPVPPNPSPCALYSVYLGAAPSTTYNAEASTYIQDRWSPMSRLLIEPGVRFDWDEIVRRPLFSPRLAGTYVLDNSGNTKISAGIGVVYQSTLLSLIAAPLQGSRHDYFFDPATGDLTRSVLTTFSVDRSTLLAPRYLNWSVALERKLPGQIFLKTEFLRRSGKDGFVYNTLGGLGSTDFFLQNTRHDRYYSFKVDLRRTFRERYTVNASYTRARSTSDQVLDYSLDSLLSSPQVSGPYGWDSPNRFISWGLVPLVKGFDLAYSMEARSGFPFPIVSQQQQLVLPPGVYRFPMYFTLNPHIEKRFHALGFYWALRGGFDNVTNRQNAYTVDNIAGTSQYLRFSSFDRRAFTARIRFLGRK